MKRVPPHNNDFRRIQLLKRLPGKTQKQKAEEKLLTQAFPTYLYTEQEICSELSKHGFIRYTGDPGHFDEDGNPVRKEPFRIDKYVTTEAGLSALKHSYPSEFRAKVVSDRIKKAEFYGILIAAIGGVITILSFLYKSLESFFNN